MEKATRFIVVDESESCIHWHIHRPERLNALGPLVGQELQQLTRQLAQRLKKDHTPRLLAITASRSSGNIWVAGGDLKELASTHGQKSSGKKYSTLMTQLCRHLEQLPIPVAMLMDGQVIGGATEFALAADFRAATPMTSFYFKQTEIGLATAFGGAQRLVRHVGLSKATYWLLLNQHIQAEECLHHGLIHTLCASTAQLDEQARQWATHLAGIPFEAVAVQKKMLQSIGYSPQRAQQETNLFSSLWLNPFHKDFLKRFNAHKKPASKT